MIIIVFFCCLFWHKYSGFVHVFDLCVLHKCRAIIISRSRTYVLSKTSNKIRLNGKKIRTSFSNLCEWTHRVLFWDLMAIHYGVIEVFPRNAWFRWIKNECVVRVYFWSFVTSNIIQIFEIRLHRNSINAFVNATHTHTRARALLRERKGAKMKTNWASTKQLDPLNLQ